MNIIAPNNRRPASTIIYLIQCLISLLLTVTLIVSLVQPAQNTSPCPDRQSTLGPRPAGPILTRDRGGQRRRPTHPPRWARSNQWNKQWEANPKKVIKNSKNVQQTLCDKLSSAKLSDYLPSMEQQEDGLRGSHNLLFSTNDALNFILDL